MSDKIPNLLFVCTGHSARPIMAEGISRCDTATGEVFPVWLDALSFQSQLHDIGRL